MNKKIKYDFLGFEKNRKMVNNEEVFLSTNLIKYNDLGFRQERTLVITAGAVYNIRKTSVQRRIPLEKLEAMTLSNMSSEFVFHVKDNYDYRMSSFEKRKEIVEIVAYLYIYIRKLATVLPIYYVENINLNKIMTTSSHLKKRQVIRPDKAFLKLMSLEDLGQKIEQEDARVTEIRKGTTMLFNPGKTELCIADFDQLKILGQGAFGKVVLAQKKDNRKIYAIKILKKREILSTDQLEHTLAEKLILSHVNHPFLVGLEYAFQTVERVYFVMEFMKGGEMFQHMRKVKKFTEKQAKFFAACVTLGLGHLHTKNYIYRDLKLENILLDENGYAKLTDFGLAKFIDKEDKAMTFCGTPEYLSPEVILGRGHNRPADWWSLGILIYEMMSGLPPFYSTNMTTMYKRIIRDKVSWKSNVNISNEGKDLILKLLSKNPKKRLGSEADSLEVLCHPWFEDLDWTQILEKKIKSPYIPETGGTDWIKNFDSDFTSQAIRDTHLPKDVKILKELANHKDEFDKFNFNIDDEISKPS